MTTNDPLAACLSKIDNAEKVSQKEVVVRGVSKMKNSVLEILKKHEFVSDVTYNESQNGGTITITLSGSINKCGVIKPRYKTTVSDIERFEQRYLPAKGFGLLIISTSKGLLTNAEAKEQNVGGRLIAYCY